MKTEKEKMLCGELYDANYDKSLIEERIKCKMLCFQYNNISPEKIAERKKLIKKIIGKTNGEFLIELRKSNFWR